jgi:hypothetical protein
MQGIARSTVTILIGSAAFSAPLYAAVPERAAVLDAMQRATALMVELPQTSHPYRGDGSKEPASGDFAGTYVGDESDTSPFTPDTPAVGISTAEYLRNMNVLIRWLTK